MADKYKFEYDGPADVDGCRVFDRLIMETWAVSPEKALSNITWKASRGNPAGFQLYRKYLRIVEIPLSQYPDDNKRGTCPECGRETDDSGCCPVCHWLEKF